VKAKYVRSESVKIWRHQSVIENIAAKRKMARNGVMSRRHNGVMKWQPLAWRRGVNGVSISARRQWRKRNGVMAGGTIEG